MLFIYLFAVSSCSKEETTYSCNPEINEWTQTNLDKYAKADRNDMSALPIEKQRALMRGFIGEHKVRLWNEKFRTLLTEVSFSEKEKKHLQKLFGFLKPKHYDTENGFVELQTFVKEWTKEAKQELGWEEKEFFLYTSTLFTIAEFNEYITSNTKNQKYMENEPDCECYYSWYCTVKYGGEICFDDDCKLVGGCGVLGSSNCTGMCG